MKKAIFIFGLIVISAAGIKAQYVRGDSTHTASRMPERSYFMSHSSIGGNFGLELGSTTIIALSPLLNIHPTQKFVFGAGPIYQYYNITDPFYGVQITGSIYGARVVAQYYLPGNPDDDDRMNRILANLFVTAEYDLLNVPYQNSVNFETARTTIAVPLVGFGYRERAGSSACFTLSCMWDLSGSQLSPYYSNPQFPVFLVGFDFGL